jgi:hypothetical protein
VSSQQAEPDGDDGCEGDRRDQCGGLGGGKESAGEVMQFPAGVFEEVGQQPMRGGDRAWGWYRR